MAEEVIMRSKDVIFRGKKLEDLKALDVRESAKYMKSRSRRTILRNFNVIEKFLKRCEKKIAKGKKIRTQNRDLVIVPKLVGLKIGVYNGKVFEDVTILPEMIGHRLGEFAMTRGRVHHGEAGIGSTKSSKAAKK
jgi:small subunit ribosomal protein S19